MSVNGIPIPPLDDDPPDRTMLRAESATFRPDTPRSWSQPQPAVSQILPVCPLNSCLPHVSCDTVADLIRGKFTDLFEIVDCRYDYEFAGGHIRRAVNMTNPNDFVEQFFRYPREDCVIVFHCEFSQSRGPKMAMQFRDYDRTVNRVDYPALSYPHVFIMHGGYRDFYELYPELCDGAYVLMLDDAHRRNGDLSKCTSAYQEAMNAFESTLRPPTNRGIHSKFMSPRQIRCDQSPITKAMSCFSVLESQLHLS
jgi:M-phase inducer tyrosine phosphatase